MTPIFLALCALFFQQQAFHCRQMNLTRSEAGNGLIGGVFMLIAFIDAFIESFS